MENNEKILKKYKKNIRNLVIKHHVFFLPSFGTKNKQKILTDLHAHAVRNIKKISRQNMKKI